MAEEDLLRQIEEQQKEIVKLTRKLGRLQDTLDRNKAVAASTVQRNFMRSQEQQKQEKYMQLLLENSPDIILLFDEQWRFSYCTSAFLEKAHIASFGLINGRPFTEVFCRFASQSWIDALAETLSSAMKEKKSLEFEETIDMSGGGSRKYTVHFTPMYEENFDSSILMLHDITEIRNAQEEAERASSAKSDFLSNMSHEMRTPMNASIGMTAIGKKAVDLERKNYAFGKIGDASVHLLGVINDILDMSKIEANKLELSYAEFDFEKMLQKVVNVVNFRVEEKGQNFTVHIGRDVPRILIGDDQRLAQVVANLLSNAVKFTPEGGAIALDSTFMEEKDGLCTIKIEVKDSGIGISQEQQARLFTSFQQAESNTSRKFGGTGLGLAISKRIVEMMGGAIWIESELGKGSTFAFTLRARRGEEKQSGLWEPGLNENNRKAFALRVLVVDDAPDIREYFAEIAQQIKVACDVAAGGEEALALIENEKNDPYDVYFVDWKMPGMDGIELCRRIKDRKRDNSVVIMISAAEWNAIEADAKEVGVSKFLSKPLFPSAISDIIAECFGAAGLPRAKDAQPEIQDTYEGRCILLAEDVEINREIVVSLLEPAALTIDCAENGKEAVSLFEANWEKYDMIFMDVQMPEMDGFEATRRIRALDVPKAKTVPIVAMTANVFREDVEKCLAVGMNDHVGKPLDFEEVLSKLREYLPQNERLPR
jgi:signal transduction histidine kinase/DNA-binding response OmpR family regulator